MGSMRGGSARRSAALAISARRWGLRGGPFGPYRGERIEDGELVLGDADREPGNGFGFRSCERQCAAQELGDDLLFTGFGDEAAR